MSFEQAKPISAHLYTLVIAQQRCMKKWHWVHIAHDGTVHAICTSLHLVSFFQGCKPNHWAHMGQNWSAACYHGCARDIAAAQAERCKAPCQRERKKDSLSLWILSERYQTRHIDTLTNVITVMCEQLTWGLLCMCRVPARNLDLLAFSRPYVKLLT